MLVLVLAVAAIAMEPVGAEAPICLRGAQARLVVGPVLDVGITVDRVEEVDAGRDGLLDAAA